MRVMPRLALVSLLFLSPVAVVAAPATDAALTKQLDALLAPVFAADKPGATVLVARNGTPVYRHAFGLANVEKKSPNKPETAFRIGSVTKQFTSAIVMRLVERGTIGLQDDITKYLPDFPTQGTTITIENLLTHTSGIADYTSLPEWQARIAEPMTPAQIISLFQDKPHNFAPGEKWAYCNAGYFLLGAIIEKVTGKSYADNLSDEIFTPLHMTHSSYGGDMPSPGEASGYRSDGADVKPADPLSMTSPYAAGAIVSSVDDLLKWDNAINAGSVLKKESLARTFTSVRLKDGHPAGYGYGWLVSTYEGHTVQEHNGGINGFFSHVTRLPDDHLYIALLENDESPAVDGDFLALKIAAVAVGKPLPEPGAVTMTPEQLDRFVAVYALDSTTTRTISREGGVLYSQRSGGARSGLFPTSDSTFAFTGRPATLTFGRNATGAFDRVTLRQSSITETYHRTGTPVPAARTAIALDAKQLDACAGVYELAPTFRITVTHEGTNLMAQATGQPKFELFPESPTRFFLKVVDAQVEFTPGADGRMESLTLHQAGRHTPGKRVE